MERGGGGGWALSQVLMYVPYHAPYVHMDRTVFLGQAMAASGKMPALLLPHGRHYMLISSKAGERTVASATIGRVIMGILSHITHQSPCQRRRTISSRPNSGTVAGGRLA